MAESRKIVGSRVGPKGMPAAGTCIARCLISPFGSA